MINKVEHKYAKLFPMQGEAEIKELANDIKLNGLQVPIVLYEDQILDGRNRYAACKLADVEPIFTEYEGSTPLEYVLSLNLHRRHLDSTQKAVIALDLLPLFEEIAAKKKAELAINNNNAKKVYQNDTKTIEPISAQSFSNEKREKQSRDKVADIVNVGRSYIQDVKKISMEHPKYIEPMRKGEITLQEVKKELKEAKTELYRSNEKLKKDISNIIECDINIYNNDISDAPIADNSLDAIITDPPYPREFLHCWDKLALFAEAKLKDGGILLAMSGQSYLPYIYNAMNIKGLNYYWTNCFYMPGIGASLHTKRLIPQWKPVLFYVKGEYNKTFQKSDVFKNSSYEACKEGQEFHKWGQDLNIVKQMVNDYTYATDIVCDPFLGGGTTGVACKELKRNFIGIELDKNTFEIAKERIL